MIDKSLQARHSGPARIRGRGEPHRRQGSAETAWYIAYRIVSADL